jgi:intracellular septation protein A
MVRVGASILVAVVAPAAVFAAALTLLGVAAAVAAALGFMVLAMCWRWWTDRPVSGLLVLTLAVMSVRTGFTLATGNTFVYFIQPVFADGLVAVVFLGSLWTARPVVARIAPDFYPMDAATAARPAVRALFRRLTLMWGMVVIVKGGLTLWLLESQSTVGFVLIRSTAVIALTSLAAVVTVALSVVVGRREGMLATP